MYENALHILKVGVWVSEKRIDINISKCRRRCIEMYADQYHCIPPVCRLLPAAAAGKGREPQHNDDLRDINALTVGCQTRVQLRTKGT